MNNLYINVCKFFKFVQRILFGIMSLAIKKNDNKQVEMSSSLNYLITKGDNTLMRKFSLTDLPGICDELERVINYLKSSTNIEYFLYDYPGILEARLENNILELHSLLREIKSVNLSIQQQNQQKILFNKEKISLKKALKKLKDCEIREMETVVSLFDKAMFIHWEKIKSTRKPEVLEQFLSDVMSKQLALDNLNVLAARKLTNLRKFPKGKCSSIKKNESNSSTTEISKIPLPPLPTWAMTNYTSCNLPSLINDDSIRIESIDEELDL
ncbi:uncharacterized protein LOC107045158 [Diachasma alloeum]|uniref:uncharacterized protein LOC107045158 n=1 Tax=Diachasma alloeum TaxID=454923 RepID=UPI0007381C79|nr:uncharacterized protein LOC107045158 [Diachasma alloeum]